MSKKDQPVSSTDVTEAERTVLEILWERPGGSSVREIVLAMYGRHEHSLHGGVKSFLDRLMDKGLVTVDKSGFAHLFSATLSRESFVGRQLKHLADHHFGGSLTPMLLSLVEQVNLDDKKRATLERIINQIKD
ncbi:Penicillinase repressor [Gimesia chilikensis]|nr:Penicillinase repressor [Gimesia chilikensis]